jgi:hypothetical protein
MNWCGENGGFPSAFVVAVDYIDSEGTQMLSVARMDDQPLSASMGLSTCLDMYFRDDAQAIWREMERAATEDDDE